MVDAKNFVFKCSDSFEITDQDQKEMIIKDMPEDELWPIQFKTILMDLNLTPGSHESIEFHR